jgi:sugar/nucleoside kinase (ribokinase family)
VSTLVVGSIALDTVETPFGRAEEALGGTAVYFSLAASLFTSVQMVGVVGRDFPVEGIDLLQRRKVDLAGLQRQSGETFRWVGEYDFNMNIAHTLDTRLNVFETFHPTLPERYRDAQLVFLGNIDPVLQLEVLQQVRGPRFTALDTMNFWIERKKTELSAVVRRVDALLINESEIREFTGQYNVLRAARDVQALGPRCVVVKRGEYGSLLFVDDRMFVLPAYPTFDVKDTTGAGDSFAGGFMGYLDTCDALDDTDIRRAAVYGTILASFTVEDFSIGGLIGADQDSMKARYARLQELTHIEMPYSASPQLIPEGV